MATGVEDLMKRRFGFGALGLRVEGFRHMSQSRTLFHGFPT